MNKSMIETAVETAKSAEWVCDAKVSQSIKAIDNPKYRVFIAGQFQVGKSLLVDRVFLNGQRLLKSGIGIPTTSVVTELEFGEVNSMRVHFKDGTPILTQQNPTAGDVAAYTTAESEEERKRLSERIEKVVLSVPNVALQKYGVFDSPGIDDANESVMINSTLAHIAMADAVVLVIPPRMFDNVEKEFIQGELFNRSISRLMIAVSYNPANPMGKQVREELLASLKAELGSMGREYVPVRIICYDNTVDELLNNEQAILHKIDEFAVRNVAEGRLQRIAGEILLSFDGYINELRARLAVNGADAEKINELKSKIEKAEQLLSARLASTKANVSAKEVEVLSASRRRLETCLSEMRLSMMQRFDQCNSLEQVQACLADITPKMKQHLKEIFSKETDAAKTDIKGLLVAIDQELQSAADEIVTTFGGGYEIETGWLGKLNGKFVTILDYLLVSLLSPLALGADVLIRWLVGKIPGLRRILPVVFIKDRVVKTISNSLCEISQKTTLDIQSQLEQCFKRIKEDVEGHFKSLYQVSVMPLCKALDEAEKNQLDDSGVEKLKNRLSMMKDAVNSLSVNVD